MKRQFSLLSILLITVAPTLFGLNYENKLLKQLTALPEAEQLYQNIQKEGGIGIYTIEGSSSFDAYWNGSNRGIYLVNHRNRSLGKQLCSVIFELHNAATDYQMQHINQLARDGLISRDQYIERFERIEHSNAMKTIAILNKGREKGIYPHDAQWYMPASFNEYFRMQKRCGHSEWFGRNYDQLTRYRRI